MIDTIVLSTNDFRFDSLKNAISDCKLMSSFNRLLARDSKNCELGQDVILKDIHNIEIVGHRLLSEKPYKNTLGISIKSYVNPYNKIKDTYLKLNLSVPKYLTGLNYYTSNLNELKQCLKTLESDLFEIGIDTDLCNCKISRIDLTKNALIEYPFFQYLPILNKIETKFSKTREFGGETFYYGNESKNVCCYDKKAESLEAIPKNLLMQNHFRCEFRSLNSKTCKNEGLEDMRDLLRSYDDLKELYKCNVRKLLFANGDLIQKKDVTNYQQNFMSFLHKKHNEKKRVSFESFILDCLLQNAENTINDLFENLDSFLELESDFLLSQNKSDSIVRFQKSQHKKQWTEIIKEQLGKIGTLKENTINDCDLYNELYKKLLQD